MNDTYMDPGPVDDPANSRRTAYKGSYIVFRDGPRSPSGKTRTWTVLNDAGRYLGTVRWWASWRKYCYFPEDDTVLEQVCLRELATFVENRTQEHRR